MDTSQPSLKSEDDMLAKGDKLPGWNLDLLVAQLRLSREVTHNIRHQGRIRRTPSREVLSAILDDLSAALFPSHYGQSAVGIENIDYFVGHTLNNALQPLAEQVGRSLVFGQEQERPEAEIRRRALLITQEFAARLPAIRGLLVSDLRAAFQGDPAATNFPEILLGYPGMTAIVHYRLANAPAYPRRAAAGAPDLGYRPLAHRHRHPSRRQIGPSFFIDHGTGVVIGETAIIGERVRLYQAVTLGAQQLSGGRQWGRSSRATPRHPIIEDDVVIYAGATILGRITIGRGSTIGGNVWLTRGVPPGSQITQAQTRSDGRVE